MTDQPPVPWSARPYSEVSERTVIEDLENPLAESCGAVVDQMLEAGRPIDAVQVLGQAVTPRESVWWAWSVLLAEPPPDQSEAHANCLAAVGDWLVGPTDEHRRAIDELAEEIGRGSPEGCLGAAVFFAEGSLGPAGMDEEVLPPEGSCGAASSGAVLLWSFLDVDQVVERQIRAVEMWKELDPAPRPWDAVAEASGDPEGYDSDWKPET